VKHIFLAFVLILLCPIWAQAQVTTMLSPVARQYFFGPGGVPAVGYKLCSFSAGTTSPLATYTDSSGSFQASNPIILDGFGSASIWLAGLSYKFQLLSPGTDSTCATGTQQWVVDNISDVAYLATLNAVLLTGNQSIAGNKVFTGSTTFSGTATFNNGASFPSLNNIVYVGGTVYPQTAAGINAAINSTFGAPIEVVVNFPGSYCDTVVNPANLSLLTFGPGVYQMNIAGADSSTANVTWGVVGPGSNQTTIESCPTSNLDVLTSQHFSNFTGGSNFYGVYHPIIRGLTIDGNNSNESSGYGIRLYGRAITPFDVLVQNAVNDCHYYEWGGTESDTGAGTQVNGQGSVLEGDYCGGNGFTFKGTTGALNGIGSVIAHNNGGWGLQTFSNIAINQINSYENTSGGCDVKSSASLTATNVACDTGTGWGLLFESGSGGGTIQGGFIGGGIPLELDSAAGGTINAIIDNPAASTPCLKLNGASAWQITVQFEACTTDTIAFTSDSGNNINGFCGATYPLYSGTPATQDAINLNCGTNHYQQFPLNAFTVGNYTESFPTGAAGTTLLETGNGDPHFQYAEVGGCTTGSSAGNLCATPITLTWTTAFADTAYKVVCTGYGVASGFPSSPFVVTKLAASITINYAAITGVAAAYTDVDCWGVHN
jgi:hypothetical protein